MKNLRRLNGITAALAAGAMLFAADGALAHSGDHHGSDSSQMKSHDSKSDHSDKHSEKYKDKSGDMRSDKQKDKDSKHAERMKEKEAKRAEKMKEKAEKHAEKMKDKDKDKTTTTTTTATGTPAPGSKDDLFGKGIVGRNTDLKPVPSSAAPGTPSPGTGGTNNIHPIMSPPPAPGAASPATPVTAIGGGLVRDKLPDGTVYVRRGTSAELAAAGPTGSGRGIVTVSDGKGNSVIIPDHGAGVTVTNTGPGQVTISNGVESRTVSGIALNISGASAVAVDKSLGTGPRQADGSTTVLTPNGTVTVTGGALPGGGFEAYSGGQHYP